MVFNEFRLGDIFRFNLRYLGFIIPSRRTGFGALGGSVKPILYRTVSL